MISSLGQNLNDNWSENMHLEQSTSNVVRQSNNLVESPYSQEFSAHEIKLFEIAVSKCEKQDINLIKLKNNKEFRLSTQELANLLNTKSNVISMEIEKTAARIMKKTIHLRRLSDDGNVEFQIINIIPYAQYKKGIFEFHLNYLVIPYLIEINSHFTEYQLKNLLFMTSAYAIKLYKLLYQYKNIKNRAFSVIELKEQFGVLDKYPQYKDFKRRIITPSIEQINTLTDLTVRLNEIKCGRSVDRIEFIFEVKGSKALETKTNKVIDVVNGVVVSNLASELETKLSSQTKALITQYQQDKGLEYVDASISYAKKNAKTNFDKYLADTLSKGWAEVEIKKQTIKKKQVVEKVTATKQANLKKEQEKEQDRLSKAIIEDKWNDLLDEVKAYHVDYANSILNRYTEKLSSFSSVKQYLPLCIYAVSNQTSYDRALESYVKHVLNVSLNIN